MAVHLIAGATATTRATHSPFRAARLRPRPSAHPLALRGAAPGESARVRRRGGVAAAAPPGGEGNADSVEETTRKYGLEAGLWKVFTAKEPAPGADGKPASGEKMSQAKELLKRYGSAYLITSISLSIVSFGLSYALISAGVDVASLLEKVGLTVTATSEQVGAVALAYAVHKAASPIRFPPTVALTPLVARWMGKEVQ